MTELDPKLVSIKIKRGETHYNAIAVATFGEDDIKHFIVDDHSYVYIVNDDYSTHLDSEAVAILKQLPTDPDDCDPFAP